MNTNEHKLAAPISVQEIALEGLRFAYAGAEKLVVDDISMRIRAGELVAIVGPNGCGKSTLLKLLVGSLAARGAGGRILVDGRTPAQIGRIGMARRIAIVPQMAGGAGGGENGGLAGGGFTAREVVLMSRYAAHVQQAGDSSWGALGRVAAMGTGFETAEDLRLADLAMWASDVHHLANRAIDTLSGGERQRVTIARAMAQQTPILLLDEPTSALDLHHQLELIAQLRELTRTGHIVLMVTHDLNLAARFATRVVVMDLGRIVADGPPAQVLTASVLEPVYRVKVQEQADGTLRFERMEIGGQP